MDGQRLRAWRPAVPGVAEVLHARFVTHAYPPHTHDAWTLLVVDDGAIHYDLDRHGHGAVADVVTLLPPDVPHDGRAATPSGFVKRVVYLEADVVGRDLTGAAVDHPALADPLLRRRVAELHLVLDGPGDEMHAESRLALVVERLRGHLGGAAPAPSPGRGLARDLRDLLDAHVPAGLTLAAAAESLGAHPTHLVRAFTAAFGLPPHAYLVGRRVDRARRLLLAGQPAASVAAAAGFYDQAHLTRTFRRYLGTTPAKFATSR
ncbi:AraC family transcriptional regulator [Asanoa sp. WMMD1127]|uniref:helix-turn-helix transcriptional regulator n=1 Tax=Asanoa sp. WMMD1127 TaxID=3016107 RepID=UPI0024160607|nr:AraC family transcriptional regulator [Asanoa sp. WMMD1127]MDG4826101.1 AraC family transcriptional regulator [Asanoa sp. WMMD1127]